MTRKITNQRKFYLHALAALQAINPRRFKRFARGEATRRLFRATLAKKLRQAFRAA